MKSKLRIVEGGKKRSIFQDLEALRIRHDDDDPGDILQPVHSAKRRQFRRFDETWAAQLLAADPPASREALYLMMVLLAEADFHRKIKITDAVTKAARLTRFNKRKALEDLERLGLIAVEWRGSGRAPMATPLRLGGRPNRR